ncbi:MAG: hypothetical protein ACRDS1_03460 [Pseudonocardiaceae bacterium]
MNTRQGHDEGHEQAEGSGGRVRRFLDSAEPVGVQTGHPGGTAAHPNTAPPTSTEVHDTGVHHTGVNDTGADDPGRDRGADQAGLLNDVAGLREEWQRVQSAFVDDPSRAVHEASVLIDRTLDEIRMNVGSGYPRETTSTEELRVSFQRYREFFQRLLSA